MIDLPVDANSGAAIDAQHVLDHDDGVRPGRNGGASHDLEGLTGQQRCSGGCFSGAQLTCNYELTRGIGRLDGKSITERAGYGRIVAVGAAGLGQHAAVRGFKRHLLDGRKGGKPVQRIDNYLPGRLKIERSRLLSLGHVSDCTRRKATPRRSSDIFSARVNFEKRQPQAHAWGSPRRRMGTSMKPVDPCILAINGGSSSIKFALFQTGAALKRSLYGSIDRIGLTGTKLTFEDADSDRRDKLDLAASDHRSAADFLMDWLEKQITFESVKAVGHRVVHGMQHTAPELVTRELLDELNRMRPYDPEHLPGEIELIETIGRRYPKLPQVACFDTAFHRSMPRVAKLLPIPRRYDAKGIERYGFHGLSYAYLMEELARLGDRAATAGRVILAHLGNGASLAAVREGKSIDTSMGFTPTAGLVMSTRSGDLDPGVAPYLERTEQIETQQFYEMVNQKSGLLGVSEISSDMRELLAQEAHDIRAAEAVALFCYQAKKWIGSFAAAMGGLDTLVFSAGIGENAAPVRARICDGLGFLGIEVEEPRNASNAGVISTDASRVTVRVIRTNEEMMIARSAGRILEAESANKKD